MLEKSRPRVETALHRSAISPLYFALASILFLAGTLLTGCGLSKDYIRITYEPQTDFSKIEGADSVRVDVSVSDQRTNKENVGKKGDEYSFLAPIIAQNDLAETIAGSIKMELANRGFTLAGGGAFVLVDLVKFYNSFDGQQVSEVIMNVQVMNRERSILFSKAVTGETKRSYSMRSGSNAKIGLEEVLQEAIKKLVNNSMFINALFKAEKS